MKTIRLPPYFEKLAVPRRYKGLRGGRGSAKSHAFATAMVLCAAGQSGFLGLCVREVQNSITDSVKVLIEQKIENLGLGWFFRITQTEITGANGSRIIFRGLRDHTAASIKSLEGVDVCWIEEAQTITSMSLEMLIPTIRKEGSEIWASWNPDSPEDPIEQLFDRYAGSPDCICLTVNWYDNPWFPSTLDLERRQMQARDPEKAAHIWGGEFRTRSQATVFRNWRVANLDDQVPADAVWHYGVDWGFAQDPTAILRCVVMGDTLYVDHEAAEVGVPMEGLPGLLDRVPGSRRWPMRADSARPETIDYVRRHGFPKLRRARKGPGSIEDGVSFLQGMDIVVHPRCTVTAKELRDYAYKVDKRTGEVLPVIAGGNDHMLDSMRMACEGLHLRGERLPAEETPESNRLASPKDYVIDFGGEDDDWRVV